MRTRFVFLKQQNMSGVERIDYIGASWCKVCKTVKPAVELLAKEFGVTLNILDADTLDESSEPVTKVPTLRIYNTAGTKTEIVTGHAAALKEILASNAKVVISDDF